MYGGGDGCFLSVGGRESAAKSPQPGGGGLSGVGVGCHRRDSASLAYAASTLTRALSREILRETVFL